MKITGDKTMVTPVARQLEAQGIQIARAEAAPSCPPVRVRITPVQDRILVHIIDADGRVTERRVQTVKMAAILVQSWVKPPTWSMPILKEPAAVKRWTPSPPGAPKTSAGLKSGPPQEEARQSSSSTKPRPASPAAAPPTVGKTVTASRSESGSVRGRVGWGLYVETLPVAEPVWGASTQADMRLGIVDLFAALRAARRVRMRTFAQIGFAQWDVELSVGLGRVMGWGPVWVAPRLAAGVGWLHVIPRDVVGRIVCGVDAPCNLGDPVPNPDPAYQGLAARAAVETAVGWSVWPRWSVVVFGRLSYTPWVRTGSAPQDPMTSIRGLPTLTGVSGRWGVGVRGALL